MAVQSIDGTFDFVVIRLDASCHNQIVVGDLENILRQTHDLRSNSRQPRYLRLIIQMNEILLWFNFFGIGLDPCRVRWNTFRLRFLQFLGRLQAPASQSPTGLVNVRLQRERENECERQGQRWGGRTSFLSMIAI